MSKLLFGALCALFLAAPLRACTWCEQSSRFELDYLEAYFPKALVSIEQYFTDMCPEAIAASLGSMVELLGDRTSYYFVNDPGSFKAGEYFENILEQCRLVGEYLERARVNIDTGSVVVPDSTMYFDIGASQNTQPLLSYLHAQGHDEHFDFYAFYFDYANKMFNEGIRFCLLSQAYQYSKEQERLVEKLRGSSYESSYQEAVKCSADLVGLLRSRLGIEELQGMNGQAH